MSNLLSMPFCLLLLMLPTSCIIVKETVPYEPPKDPALQERIERLERREGRSEESPALKRFSDAAVGTVKAISASGGVLVLDLRIGNSVNVGTQLAIVGQEGFKGLAIVEERFAETSVSARLQGPTSNVVAPGDLALTSLVNF